MHHRWLARGLVVGLHAALLTALWLHRPPGLPRPPESQRMTVRIVPPRLAAAPPTPAAPQPPRMPAEPARPVIALPDVPVAAAATAPADATAMPPPLPPRPATQEPTRSTLRLTLPPGYAASSAVARNPALSDPRSNTPRPTLENRIADATGGAGAWVEEQTSENRVQAVGALGEHRTVMRRGNTCQEMFRSRISDTDPFNGNVAPRTAAMSGKAYRCK